MPPSFGLTALQYNFTVQRISLKGNERQKSTLFGHSRRRRPASATQQMRSFSCNYLTGTIGFKQDIYQAVVKIFGVDCTLSANV